MSRRITVKNVLDPRDLLSYKIKQKKTGRLLTVERNGFSDYGKYTCFFDDGETYGPVGKDEMESFLNTIKPFAFE